MEDATIQKVHDSIDYCVIQYSKDFFDKECKERDPKTKKDFISLVKQRFDEAFLVL